MKPERVARMLEWAWAFDLESHRIQPGLLAPPVVCASVARWDRKTGRSAGRLLSLDEARVVFMRLLDDERVTICGANISYDCLCMAVDFASRGIDIMPKIFAAYEAGRVWDLQIAEALHAIARGHLGLDPRNGFQKLRDPVTRKMGRYSLSICLDLVLGRVDAKVNDKFRMSYALLEGTPMADWPIEARVYPVDDACNTLDICLAQAGLIARPSDHVWADELDAPCASCGCSLSSSGDRDCPPRLRQSLNVHDLARQCYAAFAMHLGAAWGFAVDSEAVAALEARVRASRTGAIATFVKLGYLREEHDRERALALLDAAGLARRLFKAKAPDPSILELLRDGGAVKKVIKSASMLKRATALAYGASGACPTCAGVGKVSSAKSGNPVGCRACDSTGLNLDSAPVPRTKGSKCRTCSGKGEYPAGKPKTKREAQTAPEVGTIIRCRQCEGQAPVIPGCGTGRDALYESGDDDVLIPFAEYLLESKTLETYIPFLRKGMTDDGIVEVDFDLDDEAEDEESDE